jgi:hypothetical protein
MPNYIKNKMALHGSIDEINELFEHIKNGKDLIDFNKIIPRPESLNIESSSTVDNGLAILKYQNSRDDSELKERLNYHWVISSGIKTTDELSKYLLDKNLADIKTAQIAMSNIEMYGHKDWYSWSVDNWGTKWNAGDSHLDDNNNLVFETAWSIPLPIFLKISEMFPDVTITIEYADEDIGSNCGSVTIKNSIIIEDIEYDGIKACEIWEYDPADFFPDYRRDKRIDEIIGE